MCGSSCKLKLRILDSPIDNTTTVHAAQPVCKHRRRQLPDRYAEVNSTVQPGSLPYTSTAVHKLAAFTCHFALLLLASGRSRRVCC